MTEVKKKKKAMGCMTEFLSSSTLFGCYAPFIEDLYERIVSRADPAAIAPEWRSYFRSSCAAIPVRWSRYAPVIQSFVRVSGGAGRTARSLGGDGRREPTMHSSAPVLRLISKVSHARHVTKRRFSDPLKRLARRPTFRTWT
jgi:2-oxoglutarate dehydrogenase complex dehydrogenase (E1) component-like enzyme